MVDLTNDRPRGVKRGLDGAARAKGIDKAMIWTAPNILTLLRLLAAPAVALVFSVMPFPNSMWWALCLFVAAAATDWLDGALARRMGSGTRFGTMLDPIADKAMVVIALAVLVGLYGFSPWLIVPVAVILLRETFVSGLREFLGDTAGTLKVTRLAKWKTTIQMLAIAALFAAPLFEHYFGAFVIGMSPEIVAGVMAGEIPDELGLRRLQQGYLVTYYGGIGLIWLAALLTFLTGIDYLRKAMPYLKEGSDD